MKGKIEKTKLVTSANEESFEQSLEKNIAKMQEHGLEVEIKYSATTDWDDRHYALFTALLVARQPRKET